MKKFLSFILLLVVLVAVVKCNKATDGGRVTGSGGSTARFAISGDYLYTVDKSDLKVFNITDAANPVLKNTVPVGFEIETIYPFKDKLFIGSTSVVHIFSVDDPENPQKLSTAISPEVLRRCDPVVAKDTVAYATLRTNSLCGGTQSILAAYDIKDITRPVQKATYPVTESNILPITAASLWKSILGWAFISERKARIMSRLTAGLIRGSPSFSQMRTNPMYITPPGDR